MKMNIKFKTWSTTKIHFQFNSGLIDQAKLRKLLRFVDKELVKQK